MKASRWAHFAMLGTLAVYLCVVLVPGSPGRSAFELVLGNVAYLMPVVVLLLRGRTHRDERVWVLPLALGIVTFTLGADLYALQAAVPGHPNTEVLSATAYLCEYPLFLIAIVAALRRHLQGLGRIVVLDGVTGALAGAAVAASAVSPLIEKVWDGSPTSAVTLAYPFGDVLLVAAALGALGVVGLRNGRHFALWAGGTVVLAAGDIVYAYLQVAGSPGSGSWLDGVWAVGICLMAVGASTMRPPQTRRVPGAGSLVVVSVSAVAAVGVLLLESTQLGPLPAGLAAFTLACCGGRFLLAFHQLGELTAVRALALTDELTGVANRRALYAELDRLFSQDLKGNSDPSVGFALMLVDLDHFKEVNDSFGHQAGDDLLRAVVGRFGEALAHLGIPHLLSRLGGDEFAIVLYETSSRKAALACGAALSESLRSPVVLDDVVLHVRASIGVSVAPEHAQSRGDMLFAADAAMYAAKSSGDSVGLYSQSAAGDRRQRLTVAEDLYAALENDELAVEYQPVAEVGGGRVVGAEALVRWDHPTRGRLPPDEFLDIAERYRLTPEIAERVLDVALGDLSRWRAAGNPLRVSVNVSASDLRDERLVGIVAGALLKHDVFPSALTIEVTESATMHDPEMARTVMAAIADLGVQLSIDDYGTGYSSLGYLLRLPIDEIKLDRAFSADLADDVRTVAIVRSTIDLTHALGLHMVAEGVEDEQTLNILRDLGCDLVQGWHVGRPMSAEAFEQRLGLRLPAPQETRDAVRH